jgi:ATP phosphoribosyltransferase regulatory subunit
LAVLAEARELLATKVPEAIPAIEEIEAAAQLLAADGAISVHVDLIELRGYSYHTGLVFAALVPGVGSELARGGRYNSVGAAFGQARPATGFSADLGAVFDASQRSCDLAKAILAPAVAGNASLQAAIDALRATGEVVIEDVSGSADAAAHDCDRVLQEIEGAWQPVAV